MPESQTIGVRIFGRGDVRLAEIRECLAAIEHAYNSVYVFDAAVSHWATWPRRLGPLPFPPGFPWDIAIPTKRGGLVPGSWPPTREQIAGTVPPRRRLVLVAVRLESPGSWDFAGIGQAMDAIRQGLQDAHVRRQDKEYREGAEARRLDLENELLEIKVIREKVALAKDLGATEEQLAPLLNDLVLRPLRELLDQQRRGVIGGAEPLKLPPPKPRPDGKGTFDQHA